MATTLAFDIYGTLIDTHGLVPVLRRHVGGAAEGFSRLWRDKQLEYAFRRGLMGRYQDFGICTRQALAFACASFDVSLSDGQTEALLAGYKTLPAFADVKDGLERAQQAGFLLYAFSNGTEAAVAGLLASAGIEDYFSGVVSVDAVRSFKPDPAVYRYFLEQAGSTGDDAWLISSNPFDVIGAVSAGMRSAWVQRSPDAVFDPWELRPDITVSQLTELAERIGRYEGS